MGWAWLFVKLVGWHCLGGMCRLFFGTGAYGFLPPRCALVFGSVSDVMDHRRYNKLS